jgi:peptidoglycan/xylan/chitin deacetylase (PgdA/CDA1 family)
MAGRRALFINFHGLGEPRRQLLPGEEAFWLPREILDVWLAQAAQYPQVQITFDDGNVSDFEIALPCLKARGITAQFFVCAGHLDHPGHLAVGQLRELAAAGMGIGNHGMFHRDWRSLDDPTLLQEIVDARDRLENLIGRKISRAACPFGSYDRRVLRALRQAGYERVYTSDGGWAKAKNWIYPRNSVCRSDSGAVVDHLLREKPIGFAASVRWLKRTVKRLR